MPTQIAGITPPLFLIVDLWFFQSRAVKPDLAGANKRVFELALPALNFSLLSPMSFSP